MPNLEEDEAERSELDISEDEAGEDDDDSVGLLDAYREDTANIPRDLKKSLKKFGREALGFDCTVLAIYESGGAKLAHYLELMEELTLEIEEFSEDEEASRRLKKIGKLCRRFTDLLKRQCATTSRLPSMITKCSALYKMGFVKKLLGGDESFLILDSLKSYKNGPYKPLFSASAFALHKWVPRSETSKTAKRKPSYLSQTKKSEKEQGGSAKKSKWQS